MVYLYGVISVSKTDIPDASVRNFMQAFVTSCKRFKNFMQAVPKLYASGPKLYASGPKLYASVRNFIVTSCKRSSLAYPYAVTFAIYEVAYCICCQADRQEIFKIMKILRRGCH